jgi:hypothetical protein
MRKCNFKAAVRWHLGLRLTPEWAEPFGSRGHGPAPVAGHRIAMGQCALGWWVVPHHRLSLQPWVGYKIMSASENGPTQMDHNGHGPKFPAGRTVCWTKFLRDKNAIKCAYLPMRIWAKNCNNLILYVLELMFKFIFSVLVCIIMVLLRIGLIP